jgi:hypothetical protein
MRALQTVRFVVMVELVSTLHIHQRAILASVPKGMKILMVLVLISMVVLATHATLAMDMRLPVVTSLLLDQAILATVMKGLLQLMEHVSLIIASTWIVEMELVWMLRLGLPAIVPQVVFLTERHVSIAVFLAHGTFRWAVSLCPKKLEKLI